jgi:DNA-binding transcriptional ArsR family regulator
MSLMAKAMGVKVGNSLRKLVLIKLADNANDKGECWPSYQHIADQCECSKSAVRNHIDALEDMGLLKRENRVGVNNGKGNTSNVYYLNLDATPMPSKSTGVCHEIAPLCHLMAHPLCHQMAPEPVTLLNQSLNQTLSLREGSLSARLQSDGSGFHPTGKYLSLLPSSHRQITLRLPRRKGSTLKPSC